MPERALRGAGARLWRGSQIRRLERPGCAAARPEKIKGPRKFLRKPLPAGRCREARLAKSSHAVFQNFFCHHPVNVPELAVGGLRGVETFADGFDGFSPDALFAQPRG